MPNAETTLSILFQEVIRPKGGKEIFVELRHWLETVEDKKSHEDMVLEYGTVARREDYSSAAPDVEKRLVVLDPMSSSKAIRMAIKVVDWMVKNPNKIPIVSQQGELLRRPTPHV